MIEKIGLKTTFKELVAYKNIEPSESEAIARAKFSGELYRMGAGPKDPNIVLFIDPKNNPECRREVLIPIDREIKGIKTKFMPEIKVAFLVFIGVDKPIQYYYNELYKYIESRGLKQANEIFSLEAIYQPDEFNLSYGSFIDEDNPEHWRTEIMIPIEE
jgi:effector-binding domain-containing protein